MNICIHHITPCGRDRLTNKGFGSWTAEFFPQRFLELKKLYKRLKQ